MEEKRLKQLKVLKDSEFIGNELVIMVSFKVNQSHIFQSFK